VKHLVKYEFGLEMKGLFITYTDGTISPCRGSEVVEPFDQDKVGSAILLNETINFHTITILVSFDMHEVPKESTTRERSIQGC